MKSHTRKLLTVITEAAVESILIKEMESLGAQGYTITSARGKGRRGARHAEWMPNSNIRVEIVCNAATAEAIIKHLHEHYYTHYAMIVLCADVEELRPDSD
ncbi:MAG: hypothetical protein Q7J24_02965 [Desulfomicrobium sp.]|nr:hypothetical protein [Desulfomicrobium sp.]